MLKVGDKIKVFRKDLNGYNKNVTNGKEYELIKVTGYSLQFKDDNGEIRPIWLNIDEDDFEYEIVKEDNIYNIEQEKQRLIAKGYDVDKHIEQAKEFYKEYLKNVEYDIDVDDVIFVNDEKETVIGNIDCLSKEWLKEILLNVLEQRNALQDEIDDLKNKINDLLEEREDILDFIRERRF